MKRVVWSMCLGAVLFGSSALAQDGDFFASPRPSQDFLLAENAAAARQADWERYATAKQLIQRRAAMKAANRQARIESMKWFGYSPLRPPASPAPFMGPAIYYPVPIVVDSPWMTFYPRPNSGF